METDSNESHASGNFATRLYYSSLYFITVGVAYLWGYWSNFHVNILEYIALSDIIKSTAYPITTIVILIGIGVSLSAITPSPLLTRQQPRRDSNISRRKIAFIYYSLVFIWSIVLLALLLTESYRKWHFLPTVLAIPLASMVLKHPETIKRISDSNLRLAASFMVCILPFSAFGHGQIEAQKILEGHSYQYLTLDPNIYEARSNEIQKLRYIGHAGEQIFLYDPKEESTVIIKLGEDKAISLRKNNSQEKKIRESINDFVEQICRGASIGT